MCRQKGFNLIELMIVISIIGILAAIAIPDYLDYSGKSRVTAALAEIRPGATHYEIMLNESRPAAEFTLANMNMPTATANCSTISVSEPNADGSATAAISCNLIGNPLINGKIVRYDRSADGKWQCKSNTDSQFYLPQGCVGF